MVDRRTLVGVIMCLVLGLSVSLPAVISPATAQERPRRIRDLERQVASAAAQFRERPLPADYHVDVQRVDRQERWASGVILVFPETSVTEPVTDTAVRVTEPVTDTAVRVTEPVTPTVDADHAQGLPEGYLWLAQRTDSGWEAAIQYTALFDTLLAQAPVETATRQEKLTLRSGRGRSIPGTQAAGDPAGDFSLPWTPGQSWVLNGGPHAFGGTSDTGPWSSLDFYGGNGQGKAAREGTMTKMCDRNRDGVYTTWLRINHAGGWATDYYHLSNMRQDANGTWLNRGDSVGNQGRTIECGGSAARDHIHFSLLYNGAYVALNGREIGGWTIYNGSAQYGGRAERGYAGGNTVAQAGNGTMYNIGVTYRAHVQDYGWMGWVSNNQVAGTTGQGRRIEAFQIALQKPSGTPGDVGICYQAHVQNYGWMGTVCNGGTAGVEGQALRVEAFKIWLSNPPNRAGVCYQAHVEGYGWMGEVCNGAVAGTEGQGRRVEAIRIRITP